MSRAKSFSDVIDKEESFNKFRNAVTGYKAVDDFYEIFPRLKNVVKARKFENGILFIRAENSVWRSELNLKKEEMVKKINGYLNKEVVKKIKFI